MRAWWRRLDVAELWGVALLAGFLFVAPAVPLAISIAVSPEAIESGAVQLTPACPFRTRTGEECAGCGMTRGFCAMSRLRLGDALAYNRGAPWLYLAFWACTLSSGLVLAAAGRRFASTGNPSSANLM